MTKEEKIKEAYGDNYDKIKDHINVFGLVFDFILRAKKIDFSDWEQIYGVGIHSYACRPKSLTGIETNNGWTKIESKNDLSEESGYYKVYFSSFKIDDCLFFDKYKFVSDWYAISPSHWKPIVKDLPPIY